MNASMSLILDNPYWVQPRGASEDEAAGASDTMVLSSRGGAVIEEGTDALVWSTSLAQALYRASEVDATATASEVVSASGVDVLSAPDKDVPCCTMFTDSSPTDAFVITGDGH